VHHMTEVLGLADQYTLDSLRHVCENILIHDVEVENCCHLLKHFEAVAKTQSFEELSGVPTLLLEVTRAAAQLHQGPRSLVGGESGTSGN